MDIIYLLKVLYRKIWIILAVPVIAGISAYIFTRDIPKKYKSAAQVATGFTTNTKVQITKENFDYWESKTNFENMVETMKSELIGSMVTYNLLLHDLTDPTPFRKQEPINNRDSVVSKLRHNIETFELLSSYDPFENEILHILDAKGYTVTDWLKTNDLAIARIKDTDFIRVEFLSENPFLSAFVVNNLCEEYIRYNNDIRNAYTEESLQFFSSQVEKKRQELDNKTMDLNSYKASNQVYNYDRESSSKMAQLTEYEIQLHDEENKVNGLAISLKNIRTKIANYDKSAPVSNNSKVLELRNKINELNRSYINGGSTDKELLNTINDFRDQLQVELAKLDESPVTNTGGSAPKTLEELTSEKDLLELEYEITNSNLASIRDKVNSLKSNISRIGSKESTIASLERDRDNAQKDYSTAVEKYNEAKSKSLVNGSGVKLMIKGQPNSDPESSKTLFIIALAVVGCGSLCVGTIVLIEYFDNRIKTPVKFESFSKIKLIGYINQVDEKKLVYGYQFKSKAEQLEVEAVKHSMRKIRFNIESTDKRVILVSSTKAGNGKTFLIMSLARTLSLLNKKVLIIDTNFKNNSLTKMLVAKPLLQKSNEQLLLKGREEAEPEKEYSKQMISHTNDKNVDIIGSSEGFESPSEIFAGRDFLGMLSTLRTKYDYIFLEGASLNEYSDTRELIQYTEGVIAVFSAKDTIKQSDRESIKYLKSLNGRFMGAVLNNVDQKDVA